MSARVALHGAAGRMGLSLVRLLAEDEELELGAAIEHAAHPSLGRDIGELAGVGSLGVSLGADPEAALDAVDLVIDFSLPGVCAPLLRAAEARSLPAVVGTTGLDSEGRGALHALGRVAPCVHAPNFSQGVTLLLNLAQRATALLGSGFDAEIVELHHRQKIDAPSGTAQRLHELVCAARGFEPELAARHGRSGLVGARTDTEVGVMSARGGDVVGEHTLFLLGPGERIELTHRATDRQIFARGALRAARWVVDRSPGLYDMVDVLGILR